MTDASMRCTSRHPKTVDAEISTLARQHEGRMTAGLDEQQRGTLRELLATLRSNGA